MIFNPRGMGYSELVEMYGEEMGRSFLARQASKVKKVAKVVARNPAAVATGGLSLVAPKSVQKTLNRAVNKTAGAVVRNPAAVATGGLSLLAPKSIQKKLNTAVRVTSTGGASLLLSKQDRNAVGQAARAVQKTALRPAAHVAATVARNPAVRKLAMTAARGAAAAYTGGASELALTAARAGASGLRSKARGLVPKPLGIVARTAATPSPIRTKQRRAGGQGGATSFTPSPSPAASSVAPAASEVSEGKAPLPLIPIAIGGAGLLLVVLMMGAKKK